MIIMKLIVIVVIVYKGTQFNKLG